jgi:hypothetical protein
MIYSENVLMGSLPSTRDAILGFADPKIKHTHKLYCNHVSSVVGHVVEPGSKKMTLCASERAQPSIMAMARFL